MKLQTPAKKTADRIPRVILLIESSRASGRDLLQGVASYVHHHSPWSFYWEPCGLEKAWPVLRDMDADGIILRDVAQLDDVLAFGIPVVVVGHSRMEVPDLVNVTTDSPRIGTIGAEHLVACGFKHFAYCGYRKMPFEAAAWSRIRQQVFSGKIQEFGFDPPFQYTLPMVAEDWQAERQNLSRWLKTLPTPLGVMACNDDCGVRVMEACKSAGLTVPDVVGVVGADNDEVVCGLTDPPMSSITINFKRGGYEAARALDVRMRTATAEPLTIQVCPSHVVVRRSTDFVATEEPQLAKALRFIRDHPRSGISVEEVVQASGLSRRALEKSIRQAIGCTVLEEIRRVRTDHIARMLVETNLSVSAIADLMGFSDSQHIARYFRSAKQMNPMAYRKAHGMGV